MTEASIRDIVNRGRCICGAEIIKPENGSLGNEAYQHIMDELNYVLPAHLGTAIMSFKELLASNERNLAQFYPTFEQLYKAIQRHRDTIANLEDDIARINGIISPLVKNGQSLHQIYLAHVDELMCSEKTLYNYVDGCLFDIRNIDLPRKVKYRPRYKNRKLKVDRGCRVGRNYHDYEVYMEQHPDTAVVQMDSVIGSKGGKVLLTIYFVNVSLMLGFLREANTSKSVIDIYDELYHRLGGQDFRKLFPVILTDNGSEFSNPRCIENGPDGKRISKDEDLLLQSKCAVPESRDRGGT